MAKLMDPLNESVNDENKLRENQIALSSWRILTANKRFVPFDEEKEKHYQGTFYFIQGADIQFGFIENHLEKNPVPCWNKEIALAESAVSKINSLRPRPRFFVMCGDLTDAFPDEGLDLKRAQEADFKRIFAKLDPAIPLVCVCGNHDVGSRPTAETIAGYRKSYGDDFFSFWCGGLMFIVINSQYYQDGSLVPELAREQDEWLDRTLEVARASGKTAVVFQHIPWFVNRADETGTDYFAIEPTARKRVLKKLTAAGVRWVFAGHYHRNAGGRYGDMEMVVTSAIGGQLGSDKSGMRVVQCSEREIRHEYYSLDAFPRTLDDSCFVASAEQVL